MRNLLKPKWLFIVNTVPILILSSLLFGQYSIIKTLLEEEHIKTWKSFGMALALLGILNVIYSMYLIIKKKKVSIWYCKLPQKLDNLKID